MREIVCVQVGKFGVECGMACDETMQEEHAMDGRGCVVQTGPFGREHKVVGAAENVGCCYEQDKDGRFAMRCVSVNVCLGDDESLNQPQTEEKNVTVNLDMDDDARPTFGDVTHALNRMYDETDNLVRLELEKCESLEYMQIVLNPTDTFAAACGQFVMRDILGTNHPCARQRVFMPIYDPATLSYVENWNNLFVATTAQEAADEIVLSYDPSRHNDDMSGAQMLSHVMAMCSGETRHPTTRSGDFASSRAVLGRDGRKFVFSSACFLRHDQGNKAEFTKQIRRDTRQYVQSQRYVERQDFETVLEEADCIGAPYKATLAPLERVKLMAKLKKNYEKKVNSKVPRRLFPDLSQKIVVSIDMDLLVRVMPMRPSMARITNVDFMILRDDVTYGVYIRPCAFELVKYLGENRAVYFVIWSKKICSLSEAVLVNAFNSRVKQVDLLLTEHECEYEKKKITKKSITRCFTCWVRDGQNYYV